MKKTCLWWLAASGLAMFHASRAADTKMPLRDPMVAPSAAQAPVRAAEPAAPPSEFTPRHLMVIDGRRYVIDGGRRLGVGDLLGRAHIERIDDGAVWLREGGVLRQVSLFGGIVKRAQPAAEAASGPARPAGRDRPALPNLPTPPTGKRS